MSKQTQATSKTSDKQSAEQADLRRRAKEPQKGHGVVLTERAASRIKAIMKEGGYADTTYLFVGVKGGGCSGLQYILDLRDEVHAPVGEADEVFLSQGIVIVCDLKSYIVGNLGGTTIDFQEGLMGAGFTFNNPNARRTCGCGASYSA